MMVLKLILKGFNTEKENNCPPELFLNMNQWIFRIVKDDIKRATAITRLHMSRFVLMKAQLS